MPIVAAPTVRESIEAAVETVAPVDSSIPAQEMLPAEPVTTTQPEAKAEAPAQESDATKGERVRNPDGTFAEKPKVETKAAAEPVKPAAAPKIRRPDSWKKELEPHWDALPPEVQAYALEREKQYQTGVSTYKGEADRAKGVMGALSRFEPMLQQSNIPTDKWIEAMGNAHYTLTRGSQQDKVNALATIIRNNGVDAQALVQVLSGQQPVYQQPQYQQQPIPQAPSITPENIDERVAQALLKKEVESRYDAFTKAVADGKHKHFEQVKETMAGLLQSGLAEDYPSAYEAALRHPKHADLWEADQQQLTAQKETERKAAEQAKVTHARSQAVSVKSSTPSTMTQPQGAKSLRDQLAEATEKHISTGRV